MNEKLKNMLDAFSIFVIGKVDKKEIPEIQKKYDELIEFLDKFTILKNEEFEALEKAMSKYELSVKR